MSLMHYNPPPHSDLAFQFADEHCLVLLKPAGLLSVPGRGIERQDCLISRVQQYYSDALIVHRLDMSTSGLMVLARGKAMERALSIQFQQRQIHKRYVAVVAGCLAQLKGQIELPLITDWPNRPRQKVDYTQGKAALTRYQVLEYQAGQDCSRLLLEPETGRSHQLRVHLLSLGHPILGDELYAPLEVQQQAERLLLHACELGFYHPVSGVWLEFCAEATF